MSVSKLSTVALSQPITVDGAEVTEIALRKPCTGELRGLSLTLIFQMEVAAMTKLLSRITQPALSEAQIAALDLADFTDMASKALLFFMSRQQAADLDGAALTLEG